MLGNQSDGELLRPAGVSNLGTYNSIDDDRSHTLEGLVDILGVEVRDVLTNQPLEATNRVLFWAGAGSVESRGSMKYGTHVVGIEDGKRGRYLEQRCRSPQTV